MEATVKAKDQQQVTQITHAIHWLHDGICTIGNSTKSRSECSSDVPQHRDPSIGLPLLPSSFVIFVTFCSKSSLQSFSEKPY
jgi:hypothetical protein